MLADTPSVASAQDAAAPPTQVPPAPTPGVATPQRALLINVAGKVRWRSTPEAPWHSAAEGDILDPGAEVRTGLRASATLRFKNATVLVDANSNFSMPAIEQDGDVLRTIAQVKSGRADFKVDKVGLQNDFKVVTPSTTLAVRGTSFGVTSGAMAGTEIVGARTNTIAAIEVRYAATQQTQSLSGGGGEAKSSTAQPEPAQAAMMATIGPPPMVGTVTSASEHVASAQMGTTQTVAQTQTVNTVATVAQVVADTGAAASGSGDAPGGGGTIAMIADLVRVAGFFQTSQGHLANAHDAFQNALAALQASRNALDTALNYADEYRAAEGVALEAAQTVAQRLAAAVQEHGDTDEARTQALELARLALLAFASGSQQTSEPSPEALAEEAFLSAGSARQHADGAASEAASALAAGDEATIAAEVASGRHAQLTDAVADCTEAWQDSATAAIAAQVGLAGVQAARAAIQDVLSQRPLSQIEQSLSDSLEHLAGAAQTVVDADASRVAAAEIALQARYSAESAVLATAEEAAVAAAVGAIAALQASTAAEAAAADVATGMEHLDEAIRGMLDARGGEAEAQAHAAVVASMRAVAEASRDAARAQIELHQAASDSAQQSEMAAAEALVEAMGHLQDAFTNGGLTSAAVEGCLAALESGDQSGAEMFAEAARGHADDTGLDADGASSSAAVAGLHSDGAAAQVPISEGTDGAGGARAAFAARLAEIRDALDIALESAGMTEMARENSAQGAARADEGGSLLAEQYQGSALAEAAVAAVARAFTLVESAASMAESASENADAISAAIAQVSNPCGCPIGEDGSPVAFSSTAQAAAGAASSAAAAAGAAEEAQQLAATADAEAASAETAVSTGGQFQVAASSRASGAEAGDAAQARVDDAHARLDLYDATVVQVGAAASLATGAAADADSAQSELARLTDALHEAMANLASAMDARDAASVIDIVDEVDALGVPAGAAMESLAQAVITAQNGADDARELSDEAIGLFGDAQAMLAEAAAAGLSSGSEADAASAAAGEAQAFAVLARSFADAAIAGGSSNAEALDLVAGAAATFAVRATAEAAAAATNATTAEGSVAALDARLSGESTAIPHGLAGDADESASHASGVQEFVLPLFDIASDEAQSTGHAGDALLAGLGTAGHADDALAGVQSLLEIRSAVEDALAHHEAATTGAESEAGDAGSARSEADERRNEAANRQIVALSAMNDMLAAMQGAANEGVLAAAGAVRTAAVQSLTASEAALDASELASLARDRALDHAEAAEIAQDDAVSASSGAAVVRAAVDAASRDAEESAQSTQSSAAQAQAAAGSADTTLAHALASRALALADEAMVRAVESVASAASARSATLAIGSELDQAGFGAARAAADSAANDAARASTAADDAAMLAASAFDHGQLAVSGALAWDGAAQARAGRKDAEVARDGAMAADEDASRAVDAHNGAIAQATGHYEAAALAATSAQVERDRAFFYRDEAVAYGGSAQAEFDAGGHPDGVIHFAGLADGSADNSESASVHATAWWVESSSHANQALSYAEDSARASDRYDAAVVSADLATDDASRAVALASDGASKAHDGAALASPLAQAIATAQAMSVLEFAVMAREQAAAQRSAAVEAHQAAAQALQHARSMGERVFFTRTAEIAQQAVERSDAARIFANEAIAAATVARQAADAAAALTPGQRHRHD